MLGKIINVSLKLLLVNARVARPVKTTSKARLTSKDVGSREEKMSKRLRFQKVRLCLNEDR